MGIFVALVWGLGDLCARYGVKKVWQISTASLVLLAFCWVTWRQVSYWQDSVTLWSHALAVTADNAIGETQLGMALIVADRQEQAMERFEQAIALGTQDPTSYLNLGAYLSEHGRQKEAIPFLEKALGMNEDAENVVLTHLNLGFAYTSAGDYEQARRHYRAALQSDRTRVETTIQGLAEFASAHPSARDYRKLGLLLEEDGKSDEAAGAFRRAAELE
jgi:tetratricopeptide (TPR) repeat protein